MNSLPQIKKTSQATYGFYKYHPGTRTCSLVEREINITYGSLRKPEIGGHEQRQIRKIKREARKLDPETIQSLVQTYINNVLNSPVDDHPPPGLNAPKPWTGKGIEHKKDTQRQGEEPRRDSIDDAEASKNRAREEQYRVMQQRPVKTRTEPLKAPKKQEKPGPKKKAKVLYLPLYPTPPKQVLDKCKELYGLGEWKRILRGIHKYSWYRKRNEDKYYPGKSERRNRQYVLGQIWLAKHTGVTRRNLRKWLYRFEADGVIYIPYKGYKDRGASIIELAYTEAHRRMNKRKTGERR